MMTKSMKPNNKQIQLGKMDEISLGRTDSFFILQAEDMVIVCSGKYNWSSVSIDADIRDLDIPRFWYPWGCPGTNPGYQGMTLIKARKIILTLHCKMSEKGNL